MDFVKQEKKLIGEKLAILRNDLSRRRNEVISGRTLSIELGHEDNVVERIENGRGGQVATYTRLFNFFHNYGYNVIWIINSEIPSTDQTHMYRVVEENRNIELQNLLIENEQLRNKLLKDINHSIKQHFDNFQLNLITNE